MRLKPVKRPFECIEKVAIEIDPAFKIPPKVADDPSALTILCKFRY